MTKAERSKRQRQRWLAAGRCPRCGGADAAWAEGQRQYQQCRPCRLKTSVAQQQYYAQQRRKRPHAGSCSVCGQNPAPISGRTTRCAVCRAAARKGR